MIFSAFTISPNTHAIDEINGKILNGIKLKSLWTNNAPTQSVAGSTTFTLNDNYLNYDYVEAIFRLSTNSDRTFSSGKMAVKSQINGIATSLSNIMVYRNYSLKNGNQIIFEGGRSVNTYNTGVVEDNAVCIPVEIIGYKIIR